MVAPSRNGLWRSLVRRKRAVAFVAVIVTIIYLFFRESNSDTITNTDQMSKTELVIDLTRKPFPNSKPFSAYNDGVLISKVHLFDADAQQSSRKAPYKLAGIGTRKLLDAFVGLREAQNLTVSTAWRDYQKQIEADANYLMERWPIVGEEPSQGENDLLNAEVIGDETPKLNLIDPPTRLVMEEYDVRDEASKKIFRLQPVDDSHVARTMIKEPETPGRKRSKRPRPVPATDEVFTEYDFPERASDFARRDSIWFVLSSQYVNAPIDTLVAESDRGKAICHISALTTGNCFYLSESLEDCARRWGVFQFDVTLTHRCRTGGYWRNFLRSEANRLLLLSGSLDSTTIDEQVMNQIPLAIRRHDAQTSVFSRLWLAIEDFICFWRPSEAFGSAFVISSTMSPLQHLLSKWDASESYYSLEESENLISVADENSKSGASQYRAREWSLRERKSLILPTTVAAESCWRPTPTSVSEERAFSEKKKRSARVFSPAPFGPPRKCSQGSSGSSLLQYPIAFGTPKRNMQRRLLPKLFDFLPISLDPKGKPLNMNDEDLYQALAALSYYCPTHARGGWDCGRHYEVMGAGCVPFFIDIHAMPPHVLSQMPVRLFQEIVREPQFRHIGYVTGATRDYYRNFSTCVEAGSSVRKTPYYTFGSFNGRGRVKVNPQMHWTFDHSRFDEANYWRVARKLLKFTRKYLTSEALASYVLGTMGAGDAKRVLVVSRNAYDNLHMSLVTGLDGLGIDTTVVATADQHGLYKCFELLDSHSSGGLSLPWPDTVLLASQRINPGVRRHGVHGGGIPWANRARSTNKLNFATSLKTVTHRLFGHMNKDNFEESVRLLEAALGTPKGMNIPPAPVASSSGDFPTTTNQSATRPIDKKLQAEISLDERLAKAHRLEEELAVKEHNGIGEHSKILPYYDAIIVSFYSTSNFPYEILPILSRAVDHKVAVTDHEDSMGDPRKKSSEVAKTTYFFSRELRRVTC